MMQKKNVYTLSCLARLFHALQISRGGCLTSGGAS